MDPASLRARDKAILIAFFVAAALAEFFLIAQALQQ